MRPATRLLFHRTSIPRIGAATGKGDLKTGTQRDPELIPLGLIMVGVIGMAGYFGGIKAWSKDSEQEQRSEKELLGNWQNPGLGTGESLKSNYREFHTHPSDDKTRLRDSKT